MSMITRLTRAQLRLAFVGLLALLSVISSVFNISEDVDRDPAAMAMTLQK